MWRCNLFDTSKGKHFSLEFGPSDKLCKENVKNLLFKITQYDKKEIWFKLNFLAQNWMILEYFLLSAIQHLFETSYQYFKIMQDCYEFKIINQSLS